MDSQPITIPNLKQKYGKIIGPGLVIGGLGVGVYALLPFILTLINGIIDGSIGLLKISGLAVALVFVFSILSNKKFWRAVTNLGAIIAGRTLGLVINMDPWHFLYKKVDEAEKDREVVKEKLTLLRGQENRLKESLNEKDYAQKINTEKKERLVEKLKRNPNDEATALQLKFVGGEAARAIKYIKEVTPVKQSITNMINVIERSYNAAEGEIRDLRAEIGITKEIFEAVTSGSEAMSSAERIFNGERGINEDAEKAMENLLGNIGNMVGKIQSSIKITTQILDDKDLEDVARISVAEKELEAINAPGYIANGTFVPQMSKGTEFIKYLD